MSNLETVGPLVVSLPLCFPLTHNHSSSHLGLCNHIGLCLVLASDYWQPDSTCSRPNRFAASGTTGHQMRGAIHPQTQSYSTHTLSNHLNEPRVAVQDLYYSASDMYIARGVSRVNSARCSLKYIHVHCANQSNKG